MENSKYSLPKKHKAGATSPLSMNDSEVTVNPKRIKLSNREDSLDFSDATSSSSSSTSICSQSSIENKVTPSIVNPHLNDQAHQNQFSYQQAASYYGHTSQMDSINPSYERVNEPLLTFQFNQTPAYYFEYQFNHNAQLLPNYQYPTPY